MTGRSPTPPRASTQGSGGAAAIFRRRPGLGGGGPGGGDQSTRDQYEYVCNVGLWAMALSGLTYK